MALTTIRDFRRKELLEAALAVMKRDGLHAVTVSKIADECGASKGSVHHYFKNKRELVLQTLRHAHALRRKDIVERLRAARSPQERIAAMIDVNLGETYLSHEFCSLWNGLIVQALSDPEFARLLNAIRKRERSTLHHTLRQLLPESEVMKVLLMTRAIVESFRRWAGYSEWYDSALATRHAYATLNQTIASVRKPMDTQ
jgi:TetR/AcrR family transcriptional repressor of bet genes